MKWIFAFNQNSHADYEVFVRVAVVSARRVVDVEAICLYDGAPSPLTRWLEAQGVEIISVRSRFYPQLAAVAERNGDDGVLKLGAGAFLRMEIPRLARELNWSDEFVLYTDCDVLWVRDPTPILAALRPRFFAAAPETRRDWPLHMNTGVMWMNVRAWQKIEDELTDFTRRHLHRFLTDYFDQGAVRAFFNPPQRLACELGVPSRLVYALLSRLPQRGFRWEALPPGLNWKPYWGEDDESVFIVHFHGPKPSHRRDGTRLPDYLKPLQNESWNFWCDEWEKVAARIEESQNAES